jgi:Cd2+/Zn2+-exporting ATPase
MTSKTRIFDVSGMDCGGCAANLEKGIGRLDGVNAVKIDFMAAKMEVQGEATLETLQQRAKSLGNYTVSDPATESKATSPLTQGGVRGFIAYLLRERPTQFALVGGSLTLLTFLATLVGLPGSLAMVSYTLATAIAGYPVASSGFKTLWINRTFNLNLLMVIAAVGAIVIGETVEAAVIIFLYAVGEALEGFTADQARNSIRSLADLTPNVAHKLHDDRTDSVPVEQLAVGDLIRVKPGERVPMDGEIVGGHSGVNQAPITGESIPVNKDKGDPVYAGSINGEGALTVRVTSLAADNTLNRIIKLVEEAQSAKSPSQRRVDQFAAFYTPIMVVAALLVATVPPLFFGAPFFEPATGGHGWLYRALAMLMIACPCALVISTPVTVVSAITKAARSGVLIKGGLHLETLGRVQAIAFDKTGTLTAGQPKVTHYHGINCTSDDRCDDCDDMLALAASVEKQSAHPLAHAVVGAATRTYAAENVTNLSGRGVRGEVNGHTVTVGSHRLFDEEYPHDAAICDAVHAYERDGQTAMLVAEDNNVRGIITVADTLRDSSKTVIRDLNALGVRTVMLTGDNATVANVIGGQAGVSDVRAGLLPQDKSEAVRGLLADHKHVAMVGDGINDAPALAAATVGVAMGGAGSAQAIETADIALMADDLRQLPFTMRLSRFANRLISLNIALSVGIKLIFTVLAVAGMTSLWLAIFADVGMLVIVTLNGMRPLRFS